MNQKKAGVAISVVDKVDFRRRKIIRGKKGHYIMVQRSFLQEDNILNVYASNNRAENCMKQKLIEFESAIDKPMSWQPQCSSFNN